MHDKQLEQIKSYSRLIVHELHAAIFDEDVFDKLKATLKLAEELECYMYNIKPEVVVSPERSNVVQFKRQA